jgi:hypothetical protein
MAKGNQSAILLAEAKITEICGGSKGKNPFAIAGQIMDCAAIRMHGPEHHYLTAAVLLTAFCNSQSMNAGQMFEQVRIRASKIPPAVCGVYGVCGAALAAGCFISVFLKTTYLSGAEWQLTNQLAARCQQEIAKNKGPRCCKRSTYAALYAATVFLNETFKVNMEIPSRIDCAYSGGNETCLQESCMFSSRCAKT